MTDFDDDSLCSDSLSMTTAEHPFDDPEADVVIRSSDNVNFRTYKVLLSISSPYFRTLFPKFFKAMSADLDHGKCDWEDELPVLSLTEDSRTIKALLAFLHPAGTPDLGSLDEVEDILAAMKKYDLEAGGRKARTHLMTPTYLETEAVRVFSIAYRYDSEDETRMAAKYTLRHTLPGAYTSALEAIPAGIYHRLLEYHRECGESAVAVSKLHWLSNESWPWVECQCTGRFMTSKLLGQRWSCRIAPWFVEYMEKAAAVLEKRPSPLIVTDPIFIGPFLAKATCKRCQAAFVDINVFAKNYYGPELEKAISQVVLNIVF